MNNLLPPASTRAERIRYSLAQSNYVSAAWDWFMILAGKAAEPVLVASVLYASVKLLPIVHFPPQFDVVVFIAQFVALDVGGLSLNKLADQAKQSGDIEGATQAKRLSIALVSIMLTGVIMAGVNQVVTLDGHVATVIDTILLIARAVMAVLYSRVIHALRKDGYDAHGAYTGRIEEHITEIVNTVLAEGLEMVRQELETSLSQCLEERLTVLDMKQAEAMAHLKDEQVRIITETVTSVAETTSRRRTTVSRTTHETGEVAVVSAERDIDKVIWPLLNTGMTVRAIAVEANTSTATVGRSRKRWEANHRVTEVVELKATV